ncbi:hypothetical protein DL98DRAFT_536479 [Cadophora sp. DSE1049]|nr:hypothetical protein DL98DRAFT_536479 [Cadophora sp. DSE1049]
MAPRLAQSQVALVTSILSSGLFTNSEIATAADCNTRGVRRIRSNVRLELRTHYHTVLDEIFRSRKAQPPFQNAADVLEDLTYNMCYLFGRATKAVSICPAAYYADLVCERAKCYLSKLFDATPGPTPAGSVVSGAGGGGGQGADPNNVRIHENVNA